MKKSNLILSLAFMVLLNNGACKKEQSFNSAPIVDAGENQFLFFPVNSSLLSATASDPQNNIISYSWTKVSGPSEYTLESPDKLLTAVSDMKLGEYHFELSAKDAGGLIQRDTVAVKVVEPGKNEVIFPNLVWQCPMGCVVTIDDIYSFIPKQGFNVYLRESTSSPWIQLQSYDDAAPSDQYAFAFSETSLSILNANTSEGESTDIKIVY